MSTILISSVKKKNFSITSFILLFLLTLKSFTIIAQNETWVDQVYNPDIPGIEMNPMKGLMSGYFYNRDNTFPHSIEHFYIKLNDVVKGENIYDWTAFEDLLTEKTEGGRHVVCRFWTFYPNQPTGVPQYLIDEGINMTGACPDWNNQRLLDCFLNFISEFASRYDGDPRILMIEAGLYGSWGEWNTSTTPDVLEMSFDKRDQIANKYINNFTTTHIGLRRANRVTENVDRMKLGYYDDSWGRNTLCDQDHCSYGGNLLPLGLTENYKYHPFGGEIRPQNWSTMFKTWDPNPTISEEDGGRIEDIPECVRKTRASFLKCHYLYKNPSDTYSETEKNNALKLQKMLGYEFFVNAVKLGTDSSNNLNVNIKIQNNGVAPIYYNWEVEFMAINEAGESIQLGNVDWNITQIFPRIGSGNETLEYEKTFTSELTENGTYKILMRFKNSLEDIGYQETMPLRFANEKQDQDKDGWLTLGSVTRDDTLSINTVDNSIIDLNIFPNPTSDKIYINFPKGSAFKQIKVFNLLGCVVLQQDVTTNRLEIDLKSISSQGILLIQTNTDTKSTIHKVLLR